MFDFSPDIVSIQKTYYYTGVFIRSSNNGYFIVTVNGMFKYVSWGTTWSNNTFQWRCNTIWLSSDYGVSGEASNPAAEDQFNNLNTNYLWVALGK